MCWQFSTTFRGLHECLVPITARIGNVFDGPGIRRTDKIPGRVRAADMWNLLLLLPFLCCLTSLRRKLRNGGGTSRKLRTTMQYISAHIFDPNRNCFLVY